jgi:hypothetical protein
VGFWELAAKPPSVVGKPRWNWHDDEPFAGCDASLWAQPLQIPRSPPAEFQECSAVFVQAHGFARNRRNALLSAALGFRRMIENHNGVAADVETVLRNLALADGTVAGSGEQQSQ